MAADPSRGGQFRLQASVPYLIVNKTGLPLVVKQVGGDRHKVGLSQVAAHAVEHHDCSVRDW